MNKELRAKTNEELVELAVKLKGQLLQYRFKQAHGELEKLHIIRDTKRVLARIFTILTERGAKYDLSKQSQSVIAAGNKEAAAGALSSWKQLKKQRADKKEAGAKRRADVKAQQLATPKPAVVKTKPTSQQKPAKKPVNTPLTTAKSKQALHKMKKAQAMPRKRGG